MFIYVVLALLVGVVGGIYLAVRTKKNEEVIYTGLDKAGKVTNIILTVIYTCLAPFYMFIGMICEPYQKGFMWFLGLIVALICASSPLIAGLSIGFSVALRKKGRKVFSFAVQFAGVIAIALTFILYAIFVGSLLSPLN